MVDGSTVAQEQPEAASGVAGGAPKQMAWGSGAALVRKEVELPPSLELLEVQSMSLLFLELTGITSFWLLIGERDMLMIAGFV